MLIGVVLLTSVWGSTLQGWVAAYTISLFIYGIGVGGEYPMTSTRALESGPNGPAGTRDDRLHRGRNVVLAFLVSSARSTSLERLEADRLTTPHRCKDGDKSSTRSPS